LNFHELGGITYGWGVVRTYIVLRTSTSGRAAVDSILKEEIDVVSIDSSNNKYNNKINNDDINNNNNNGIHINITNIKSYIFKHDNRMDRWTDR
jgi:hypothetical protein